VSIEQRQTLDAILRQNALPVGSDVNEQRRLLRELVSAQPLPAEVTVTASALGGIPTAEITVAGVAARHVVLYFHGGVYVIGDAFLAAELASQIGRRTDAKSTLRKSVGAIATNVRTMNISARWLEKRCESPNAVATRATGTATSRRVPPRSRVPAIAPSAHSRQSIPRP